MPRKAILAFQCFLAIVLVAGSAYYGLRFFRNGTASGHAARASDVSIADAAAARTEPSGSARDSATGESRVDPDVLPPEERTYIWEVEHIALVLDVHAFPRIAKAIREADTAGFAAFLSAELDGAIPREGARGSAELAFGSFEWLAESKDGPAHASKAEFVEYVASLRRQFSATPRVEVRLMRLWPVERSAMHAEWQGTMKFRIAGDREPGRPLEIEFQATFALDNPDNDIVERQNWIKTCRISGWRRNESTRALMQNVAADWGIDPRQFHDNWDHLERPPFPVQGGVFVADVDRDGNLDVLVTDVKRLALFQGGSDGRFRDITESAGLSDDDRPSASALFADLDGDAFEDLIVGSQLFRNNRDRTFTDITSRSTLRLPSEQGACTVADFDRDGALDIYFVRASPGPIGRSRVSWVDDETGPGNQLWRNLGNWRFQNVTQVAQASAGRRSCFAAVWLDANNDGWPDVAVADEFGSSVLLANLGDGRFAQSILKEPFGGFCMGIAAGDFDNDGHIDLYLANMFSKAGDRIIANLPPDAYSPQLRAKIKDFVVGSELLRGKGDGSFTALGRAFGVNGVGWAYGPSFVDLDNDGWLDLYAPAGFLSYERGEPDG